MRELLSLILVRKGKFGPQDKKSKPYAILLYFIYRFNIYYFTFDLWRCRKLEQKVNRNNNHVLLIEYFDKLN